MSNESAASPPASGRGWSTGTKVLVGAGIGCLSLGVLTAVLLGLAFWWAVTPGAQEPAPAFVGDDTVGVVATSAPGTDEGLNALMVQLISELHRAVWERIPEDEAPPFFGLVRRLQRRQIESGRAARELATSLPREVAVFVVRRPNDDPTWLGVVNLAKGPRIYGLLFRWIARRAPDVEAIRYGRETIVIAEDLPAICFVDSTLLVAEDIEVLKRAIDRGSKPRGDGSGLASRIGAMSADWDIFGVFDNASGDLSEGLRSVARVLEQPPGEGFPIDLGDRELGDLVGPDRWSDVADVEVGIDVVDASTMRVELRIAFGDQESAAILSPRLERLLSSWTEAAEPYGLVVARRIDRDGATVRVALDLAGVDHALARGFEALLDRAEPPSR